MAMGINPQAIQDLLDELEESKQSRLRAWNVLQRLRLVLSQLGNMEIPPPALKTFDAEGEALEHALAKSLRRSRFSSGRKTRMEGLTGKYSATRAIERLIRHGNLLLRLLNSTEKCRSVEND
jgi:hypothetical protein